MKSFFKKNYHWVIAAVALIQVFVHTGIGANFASVFIAPVCESMEISRTDFSLAYSMKSLAALTVCFFSGSIFNRLGYRKSAFFGLCCAAGGYLLFAFTKNLGITYLACFIIGSSYGLCATNGVTRIISDWFIRYRGTVLGLVTAASGLGGSLFCFLQTTVIEKASWQIALALSAAILVVLAIAVVAVLIAANPNSGTIMGLVENAWGVFGAAFGPAILLSLFWRRFNFAGAIAGILTGAAVDILWLVFLKDFGLYEIIPGFLASLIVAVVVTLMTKKPSKEVTDLFDKVASGEEVEPASNK